MASPLIVKFVPALIFLGPFLLFFVLCACIGFCIFAAGLEESFTNIEKPSSEEEKEI
jgi:hypothetical protein